MTDTRHIQISDYNYPLPDHRIARYPLPQRDSSKLLIYKHGEVTEDVFHNLPQHLPEGALMVFNNTKVIQARLHFRKGNTDTSSATQAEPSGARIEVFLLEPAAPVEYQENFTSRGTCAWYCLVGNSKKWKAGALTRHVTVGDKTVLLQALRGEAHGTGWRIEFRWSEACGNDMSANASSPSGEMETETNVTFAEILDAMGELPIPPYLNRDTEESDKTTYQTVYSKIKGSVAAPTAGLHFTEPVLQALDQHGIHREEVTLHVGAGTFKPVKSEEIGGHDMHTEHIAVRRSTIQRLLEHQGKAIAVGTTSVRTLESLYYMGVLAARIDADTPSIPSTDAEMPSDAEELHVPQWLPYEYAQQGQTLSTTEALEALLRYMDRRDMDVLHSSTQIIIAPGYDYHIVRMMVTNFHQPQSTLLLLVSAFVHGDWHRIYDYALAHDFRFLSYGDSSLLIP